MIIIMNYLIDCKGYLFIKKKKEKRNDNLNLE
jgi:hypothetical protein